MYFYVGVFIFCTLMLIINNLLKSEKEKQIFEILSEKMAISLTILIKMQFCPEK